MPLDATVNECVATPDSRGDLRCYGSGAPRWAVVQTHPQAEHWANSNLLRNGYRTFLPLCTVQRRDRVLPTLKRLVVVPLFSRYLFVQHDNPDLWRPIRETPGVHCVLTNGNRIQYARAGDVEAVQASEALRRTPTTPGSLWRPGAPCQPRDGPFQGLPAVVLEVERQIAKVAIVMFGELRQVSVDVNSLVARE
jgi:transcription antitermination factor NusG